MFAMRAAWLPFLLLLVFAPLAFAAPQVNNVSPRGVQIGQATLLVFDGAELAPEPRIVSSLPIKSQQVKPDANGARVALEIVVDEAAAPGIYAVRLASAAGISNPVLIAVDRLPQQPLADTIAALPVALLGNLGGGEVKKTTFAGIKGQRVVVDIEAQRLGANFKPVLRMYDERGRQIAFSGSQPWLGGDARCVATLPADGNYTIELHDRVYRAGGPGMFRLKVGELNLADRVHPAAVAIGQSGKLTFLGGTLPADARSEVNLLNQLPGDRAAIWPELALLTGPRCNLIASDHAEAIEAPIAGSVQEVGSVPVGISGILSAGGEEDKFAITVEPGQKLRVEMQARRLGSPIDGVLSLRNEQGGQLANADDVPGSLDPTIAEFTVPAGVVKMLVAVKDLHGRGGNDFNYRVVVRDLAQPDFSLSLTSDRVVIPAGGTQLLQVQVDRRNYAGPIKLEFPGLPPSVQLHGAEIAPGASLGIVTLTAPAGVIGGELLQVVGRGGDQSQVVRVAQGPALSGTQLSPYFRSEIGWGVGGASPLGVAWAATAEALVPGSPLPITVQLTRTPTATGVIRLRLMTTQAVIKKKIKENNVDKEVDDLDRMLRLESDVVVAADKSDAALNLFVPADLPVALWDTALVAELLSADGKSVVATAYAPVKRFSVTPAPKPQ